MQQKLYQWVGSGIVAFFACTALPALAESPYAKPDDTWISVDGVVEEVSADWFTLDYGRGIITVEMDDGDRDADGYKLVEGDRVTVNGIIDDDFYEVAKIEASSVYVENIGTYFYASVADEEDTFVTIRHPITVSKTVVQGKVSGVSGDEFTIDTGERMLTVEVDDMLYNPLDDEGYQKIEKGDIVSVTGNIDKDLFEGRVLEADAVITLYHKEKSQ
jgi:uncharacterized protein YdeI (BOF family)